MAGSQKDTTGRLPLANDVAGGWSAQNAVLSDQELLHAVCGADLGDFLNDLGVVVAAITTNDQERALSTLGDGQENTGDEGFGVVGLLEDGDLLAQTGAGHTH